MKCLGALIFRSKLDAWFYHKLTTLYFIPLQRTEDVRIPKDLANVLKKANFISDNVNLSCIIILFNK